MIDEIRLQILIEKIEAAQAVQEKTCEKFSEILNLFGSFSETVNGYPAKSVQLLNKINDRFDNLEISISNLKNNPSEKPKGFYVFFYLFSVFFLVSLGSFLGIVLHGLIFHH